MIFTIEKRKATNYAWKELAKLDCTKDKALEIFNEYKDDYDYHNNRPKHPRETLRLTYNQIVAHN